MKQPVCRLTAPLGAAALFFSLAAIVGCGRSQDTASSAQQQQASRLSEITQKTGGEWDKLTPDDKQYLIHDIGRGDEGVARSALQMNVPHTPVHGRPMAAVRPTRPL